MDNVESALTNKIGPLAAWQWGALAGGGLLVVRLISQGHKSTGVQTVTLTPNNQPNLPSSSGQDTTGSIISAFNTLGQQPGQFSFTLPNGTVVTWSGSGISTTPPAKAPSEPPGGHSTADPPPPALGTIIGPIIPAPRLPGRGGPLIPGAQPDPTPGGRTGGTIPGMTPGPAPFLPPWGNPSLPSVPPITSTPPAANNNPTAVIRPAPVVTPGVGAGAVAPLPFIGGR